MASLLLVPIFLADRRPLVERVAERLDTTFGLAVRIRPPWFDPETCFDPSRGQYHSTCFLQRLLERPPQACDRVLALTSVDLFIPVLTYVFGEAQLDGQAAVVSLHRLRNELYGLPLDERLLADRFEKEAVHELGHTYGLVHCPEPACVMHASTYVEEVDLKTARFCERCLVRVRAPSDRTDF